jgi:hypothetical protein
MMVHAERDCTCRAQHAGQENSRREPMMRARPFSVVAAILMAVGATGVVADPIEVGTEKVPVQILSNFRAQFGRSDAPLPGLHAEGGDRHLSSEDDFRYFQLGIELDAQYKGLSGRVDFLATNAHEPWIDYFTRREFWVREASLTWKHPYGSLSAGRLRYNLGFGVEGSGDLIPMDGVRLDTEWRGTNLTLLTANVPTSANTTPQFVQLFGGYPAASDHATIGVARISRKFVGPQATTELGFTAVNPSILLGERYSLDLVSALPDGRQVKAVYQTTPRDLFGQKRADDAMIALSGDLIKRSRWHVRASWAETGDNYAAPLNSLLFPYGASYDELVFDRPLFLGAPIPTDNPAAPTVAPNYGLLMDGVELDVRYRLTDSSSLRARYMRGDQQNGVTLGEVFYFAYRKALGLGMTGEIGYGHVSAADPFRVGAPGYDMFRIGLTMTDLASTTTDYLRQAGYWHGRTQQ